MHRLLPILILACIGCSFEEHRRMERCSNDDQCAPEGICRDGLCASADLDAAIDFDAEAPLPDAAIEDAVEPDRPDVAVRWDAAPRPPDAARLPPDAAPPPPDAAPPPPDAATPLELPIGDPGIPLCDNAVLATRCWRPTDDAHADEHEPDELLGRETRLWVRMRSNQQVWTYLRFDLTPLRGRRRPVTCELSVLRDDTPSPRMAGWLALHRADPRWSEDTLHWDLRPGDRGDFTQRTPLAEANIAQLFDVHAWVLAALDEGEDALAFRLEPERTPNDDRWEAFFHSRESVDRPDASPYLSCRFDSP